MNFVRKYFIMQQINGHYSLGRNKLAHPLEEQVYSNTTIIIWGKNCKDDIFTSDKPMQSKAV